MHKLKQQIVPVLGGKLDITVNVAGSGKPILFFHSAGGFYWDDFLDGLADSHTIYAPYFPGTAPGKPDELEQLDNLWDAVLAYDDLMDGLGLEDAIVIGHSFGGLLACELAAQRREKVSKLVLIAPIGLWKESAPYTVADWCSLSYDEMLDVLFYDKEKPRAVKRMQRPEPDSQEAALWDRDFIWTIGCTAKLVWPIPDKGLKKRIHRVTADSLIVWGENDKLIPPSYAEDFQQGISKSEVFTLSECSHEPPIEQTEKLHSKVTDFLAA